jgi:hypothetical protein
VTATGYQRSYLPLGDLDGPVPDCAVDLLLGNEIEITIGGATFSRGTVTDIHAQSGKMIVVVESGGRSCAICRHIYPETDAAQLVSASSFTGKVRALRPKSFAGVGPWSPVCLDWSACERRVLAVEPPDDTTGDPNPTQV